MTTFDQSRLDNQNGVTRPQSNNSNEIIRLMPAGVKRRFSALTPTDMDLHRMPTPIVDWCLSHGLFHFPKRGARKGILSLSDSGRNVHRALERKLNGMG